MSSPQESRQEPLTSPELRRSFLFTASQPWRHHAPASQIPRPSFLSRTHTHTYIEGTIYSCASLKLREQKKTKNPAPSSICAHAESQEARVAETTSRAPRSNGERSFFPPKEKQKKRKKERKEDRKETQSLKVDFTRGFLSMARRRNFALLKELPAAD